MKYATRILVYVIVGSKSQKVLLKVRRLFIYFFSTTTQRIRLRRQDFRRRRSLTVSGIRESGDSSKFRVSSKSVARFPRCGAENCPIPLHWSLAYATVVLSVVRHTNYIKLDGPMPNVMAALPNIDGALCSTPQSLVDAHYLTAMQ